MRVLTFEEASSIIKMFEYLNNPDSRAYILDSELVYDEDIETGFGNCRLQVYLFNDCLFLRMITDDIDCLEPLLIQVEDDGTIVDFMLLDFVLKCKEDLKLEKYFILQNDYTFVMDRVRTII